MAGRLAHELNQPLTAITNYAQGAPNRLEAGKIEQPELHSVLELIRNAARADRRDRRSLTVVRATQGTE